MIRKINFFLCSQKATVIQTLRIRSNEVSQGKWGQIWSPVAAEGLRAAASPPHCGRCTVIGLPPGRAVLFAARIAVATRDVTPRARQLLFGAAARVVFADAVLMEMARSRPSSLDEFSKLSGVGAVKLERYGKAFLEVINNDFRELHPSRRRLAGKEAGKIFDQLQAMQLELMHGAYGHDKPLVCSASVLAKIAAVKPRDMEALKGLLGDKKTERFGVAFLKS